MAHKIEWRDVDVKKLVSLRTETVDGKRKAHRKYTDTVLTHPVIKADTPDDLASAVAEMIAKGAEGFQNLRAVLDHFNYGLYNSPAVQLRRGHDPKLSPAQRDALKMYASLIASGMAERDYAVALLQRQGVSDAEVLLDAMMADEEEEDGN